MWKFKQQIFFRQINISILETYNLSRLARLLGEKWNFFFKSYSVTSDLVKSLFLMFSHFKGLN